MTTNNPDHCWVHHPCSCLRPPGVHPSLRRKRPKAKGRRHYWKDPIHYAQITQQHYRLKSQDPNTEYSPYHEVQFTCTVCLTETREVFHKQSRWEVISLPAP